jgi:retron-type reverse transcriptase
LGNLTTPERVQKLRTALHAKAKAEPSFRFYALYDKIYREDVLAHAYAQCRANQGAPGIDGQDFTAVEAYGVERWLGELAQALKEEAYRPEPIRRVYIPKANGGRRPLGIPTLRDRVCMTAAVLVLEPIFEADLPDEQYGYRPGRSAQQAVIDVEETLYRGRPDVVDADLADYFGSIPHAELMKSVARRVVDKRVLHLIKMWLVCAVEETDDRGHPRRTTEAKDSGRGIPQGAPISPLLANIYMRRFVLGWKRLGLDEKLGTRIVSYADDLVIYAGGVMPVRRSPSCGGSWESSGSWSMKTKHGSAKCRRRRSTSWVTRSGGCTRRKQVERISACNRRRRALSEWCASSMR